MILEKPPHGAPCNSCGQCCINTVCPLGVELLGFKEGPCPILEEDGDKLVCGLVATPVAYSLAGVLKYGERAMSEAAALLIGAGAGCDAQLASEPRNHAFYLRLSIEGVETRKHAAPAALEKWRFRR